MVLHGISLAYRRRMCRILFLTCGLIPTLVVAVWATWRVNCQGTPYYARQLSHILGADVHLQKVVPLRPGAYHIEGLTLRQSETGRTIGTCESVEVAGGAGGFAVRLSELEIARVQMVPLWQQLHRALVQRHSQSPDVFVSLDKVRIVTASNQQVSPHASKNRPIRLDGRLQFLQSLDGPELRATLNWDRDEASDACHLRVVRHRRGRQPVTRVAVTTGNLPVRCDLLPGPVAWLNHFGADATFRGAIWLENEAVFDGDPSGGWRGELTGVVGAVDLEWLSADHLSHQLTGTGEIAVDTCRFEASHVLEFDAVVTAGPGLVSQSLLDALADHLGAVPRSAGEGDARSFNPSAAATVRPYQQLSVQLQLLPHGVALRGRCENQPPGTLVSDAAGSLLSESAGQTHSVAALLSALAPRGAATAPVNRTAQRLMQWLPLPAK